MKYVRTVQDQMDRETAWMKRGGWGAGPDSRDYSRLVAGVYGCSIDVVIRARLARNGVRGDDRDDPSQPDFR